MKLELLTKKIKPLTVKGGLHCEVEGLAYDSRNVRPGFLFVALQGYTHEGIDFIDDAVQRGAVAVVSEKEGSVRRAAAFVRVQDARQALAQLSCAFYDAPSEKLMVAGVTGTNGKSTTTFMIRDILAAAGQSPGLLGTIRYEIGERSIPATRTTPESLDIQSMLAQMIRARCRSVVMEVSSHGLAQQRTAGIAFDAAVFTNLTRDHLDYHETMDRYFEAKSLLFRQLDEGPKDSVAVINRDDPWGEKLAQSVAVPKTRLVTFGFQPGANVWADEICCDEGGSGFRVNSPWGQARIRMSLLGKFNVSNALGAVAVCGALGIRLDLIAGALSALSSVPGRLERVPGKKGVRVFVDYAHTDDALAHVLQTLRETTQKRLIAVFGCGGKRDRAKRPLMGAVAARLADYSIVTSDNPRNEDPVDIMVQIAAGFQFAPYFEMEVDRRAAIARALAMAVEGDTVLIAGKGHENYQEFANTITPFDDREVVAEWLDTNK